MLDSGQLWKAGQRQFGNGTLRFRSPNSPHAPGPQQADRSGRLPTLHFGSSTRYSLPVLHGSKPSANLGSSQIVYVL